MTEPARIAVAGAGLIGQAHIRRILEEPGAALAAVIDPSPRAREQAASRLYWLTQAKNRVARRLYDRLAQDRGFMRYDYPL